MIPDISVRNMARIANPLQLPTNDGEPHLIAMIVGTQIDISNHIESGTISSKYDDYVYTLTLNIYSAPFTQNPSQFPFKPGMKLSLYVYFGADSSDSIPLCFATIDEVSYTVGQETFSISGRNNIGHFLKETQMGEMIEVSGVSHEVVPAILEHAGIFDYYVTQGTFEWTYNFKATDTSLTAIEEVCKMFPIIREYDMPGFRIAETPSGKVIVGYPAAFNEYLPTRTYAFSAGKDCFSRSFRLSSDECYSYVYANAKLDDGTDLEQVIVPVENQLGWNIPANKIYFADFNGSTMQEDLEKWANSVALELQNRGDTEDYTGPFRPQITVGDIGVVTGDEWSKTGVITSIVHHVGKKGFSTDFTVDSGGVYNAVTGWSSTMKANGYNRRQKMADIVHEMTEIIAQEVVDRHDPIVVEQVSFDEEDGSVIFTPDERNVFKFEFDGRDVVSLVELSGGTINPRR